MTEQEQRRDLGVERVGKPIAMASQSALRKATSDVWRGKVSMKRLLNYCEGFLFSVFPELIDRSTRDLQTLEQIDPLVMTEVIVILMRDALLQQFSGHPKGFASIDTFFGELASELGLDISRVLEAPGPFEISSMTQMRWAQDLMVRLGLTSAAGMLLFVPHASFAREQAQL